MNRIQIGLVSVLLVLVPAAVFLGAAFLDDSHKILRLGRVDGITMYVPVDAEDLSPASTTPNRVVTSPPFEPTTLTAAKVQLRETKFDFGTVEPFVSQRHTFIVENVGNDPLHVFDSGTSCKCLTAEVLDKAIPPGGSGRVELVWSALPTRENFLQRVTLSTNDPQNETIELNVAGRTKALVAATPAELIAPRVKPNEQVDLHADVVSEVWDRFELVDLKSQLPGLKWEVTPISPERLEQLAGKFGVHLVVTLPSDLPQGVFLDELRLAAQPVDAAGNAVGELFESAIPLAGKVEGRLIVYGEGLTPEGTIDIGRVDPVRGYRASFLVKINDEHQQLDVADIDVTPAFVATKLVPHPQVMRSGVYRLLVEIPPGAAPGNYRGETLGLLRLTFDHPRIESLELGLSFVVPNERPRLHQVSMAPQSP